MKLHGSHAIHGIYVTCCKTSLPWACKARNVWDFVVKKIELLSTVCNNFSQSVTTRFVGETGLIPTSFPGFSPTLPYGLEREPGNEVGLIRGCSWLVLKTRNVATQLVLLQYCKTSFPFLSSVLPCLKENLCRLVLLKITLSFRCMWLLIGDLLW